MALSSCPAPILIDESRLEGWKVIGAGGFGQIFKARHRQWGCDVAIKLLHHDDGTSASLLREIEMMRQGSSPYVIQVRGVFKGRVANKGSSELLGLVMEFMERGSLASLQDTLNGAPPWPLVFRLAHQVALGINFLHSLTPPLLHLDLKPSNVLLDSSLNARLTDFGLARFYHSVTRASKKDDEEEGGTISYMPPEAFNISYSPNRASDIYSYGVLLWSIVTGKQPYNNAKSSLVRLCIPRGDRPSLDEISSLAAGRAGLTTLMELMKKCWDTQPEKRPSAFECATETEELCKMHRHAITDTVHEVLKKLDQKEERMIEQFQRVSITPASGLRSQTVESTQKSQPANCSASLKYVPAYDNVPTGRPPIQEMAGGSTANQREKARVKDQPSSRPASTCSVDETDKKKRSSVRPIQSSSPSPSSPSTGRSPKSRTQPKPPHQEFKRNMSSQFQRQFSSPNTFPNHPPPPRQVYIHCSNVTGVQVGNNNFMDIQIQTMDPKDRRRHPTAPPSLNIPPPHPGSWRDNTGGVG